jgi:predicted metal-dependent enzyme (double-stranded beta helix superfamily)
MQELLRVPGWLEEQIHLPAEGGFGRHDLHHDTEFGHPEGGFLLMCGIQRPGQDNLPHDHGTTWVVYGVYQGAIEQTKWRWSYPATDRTAPELKPLESWVQGPGDIAFFLPGEIHHTRCVAADRAVVIRLEGQKLAGMLRHRYDPQTNTAELYTSGA